MTGKENQLMEWAELECDSVDLDELEAKLDSELEEQLSDLEGLKLDREKIGNPASIGEAVKNVVWEQFINQVGVVAGEDFIKENRNLKLDLRESSHIQTGDNFQRAVELDGKINMLTLIVDSGKASLEDKIELQKLKVERSGLVACHNRDIAYDERYKSYRSNFQYDEEGNIKTDYDRIDGEDKAVLKPGYREPFDEERRKYPKKTGSASVHMDETVPIGELCRDPEVNAHIDKKDIIAFDISDDNLNPMDGRANQSKSDHNAIKWLESERDGERPAERFAIDEEQIREKDKHAREVLEEKINNGREESATTGRESLKAEARLIGGKALRSVVMGLLASLMKEVVQKLIAWFRAGERKLGTLIDSVKEAIHSFISNIKKHLLTAGNTLVTTVATAIFGPVIGLIKKAWMLLKQGYKSVKEAIKFLKNPANKNMPFSIKLMEVGKIVVVGITAGGAIVLSEVIEKVLMTIPAFAIPIPLLGSLANIIGMFLGALVSGIIGALALNLIDRMIANKLKKENEKQQLDKRNEIILKQEQILYVTKGQVEQTKIKVAQDIVERHMRGGELFNNTIEQIDRNVSESESLHDTTSKTNDDISNMLNNL